MDASTVGCSGKKLQLSLRNIFNKKLVKSSFSVKFLSTSQLKMNSFTGVFFFFRYCNRNFSNFFNVNRTVLNGCFLLYKFSSLSIELKGSNLL